jgi:hypothetical protein
MPFFAASTAVNKETCIERIFFGSIRGRTFSRSTKASAGLTVCWMTVASGCDRNEEEPSSTYTAGFRRLKAYQCASIGHFVLE